MKNPLLGIFGSGSIFAKIHFWGFLASAWIFWGSQKIVLLPTNAVAFAARSWDFFLVPNNFLWFQKIVGSQQMRMRICCSPLVFLFFCRIPRMAIFDSHSPAVRKGFLTRVKRRTKNRNYREFQISSRMEIRDSHDFSSLCAKPEKRAAVASCCWRRIFAARWFSQFCDFSVFAISTTFIKIHHDDFGSKTTLVIFQKAHLTRHAKIFWPRNFDLNFDR